MMLLVPLNASGLAMELVTECAGFCPWERMEAEATLRAERALNLQVYKCFGQGEQSFAIADRAFWGAVIVG